MEEAVRSRLAGWTYPVHILDALLVRGGGANQETALIQADSRQRAADRRKRGFAHAEQTVPFGTSLDLVADDWSITATLRLVAEVRLGAALTGRSRLTWDDVGFHHALRDLATEGWIDVVATFAVDVDVAQGSTPITSTTLASAPAVVRVAATTPKALDADAAPLELVGDGLVEASAPWASTDAAVTWAQLVDYTPLRVEWAASTPIVSARGQRSAPHRPASASLPPKRDELDPPR